MKTRDLTDLFSPAGKDVLITGGHFVIEPGVAGLTITSSAG